jgi:hypothetical protein
MPGYGPRDRGAWFANRMATSAGSRLLLERS